MSDINSSLPVRTQNNGDVAAKIVDGTTTSQALGVDASGRITIKMDDGSGNLVTSQANGAQRALDVGINVAGVQIDPRVIRALTSADVVSVVQSTTPWVTKDAADGPVTPGTAAANSSLIGGQFNTVLPTLTTGQQSAIQLDASGRAIIAPLTSSSVVTVSNLPTTVDTNYGAVGASTIRTASQLGNGTGAADFNAGVTGAQTLRTVANQGAPNTAANGWPTKITDGTSTAAVKAASTAAGATDPALVVALSPNSPLPAGTNLLGAVNLDIGGSAVSAANPVPVSIVSALVGTSVNNYNTAATVAAAATSNHTYTITTGKTFNGKKIHASASGKLKVEVQISPDGTTYTSLFVAFNSTANPNIDIDMDELVFLESGVGSTIRIIRTNNDLLSQDLYSTISGTEV